MCAFYVHRTCMSVCVGHHKVCDMRKMCNLRKINAGIKGVQVLQRG